MEPEEGERAQSLDHPWEALLCKLIGVVLFVAGFLGLFLFESVQLGRVWLTVLAALGATFFHQGKRHDAARARLPVEGDRRTVLYLRRFRHDSTMGSVFISTLTRSKEGWGTQEQELARAVQAFGTLVAIGRPGEDVPPLGAIRTYVDESSWQGAVAVAMQSASLVILRADFGPNIEWELRHAIATLNPQKLVIFIDDMSLSDYTKFREHIRSSLKLSLPVPGDWDMHRFSAFVMFYDDWWSAASHVIPSPVRSKRVVYKRALVPVFENAGLVPLPSRGSGWFRNWKVG
jgi:hypothetical protein